MELDQLESEQTKQDGIDSRLPRKAQVSPWLERTRWNCYLDGISFDHAIRLGRPACRSEEPVT
jgi:hypothetical protein